jgi:hypothetical protein
MTTSRSSSRRTGMAIGSTTWETSFIRPRPPSHSLTGRSVRPVESSRGMASRCSSCATSAPIEAKGKPGTILYWQRDVKSPETGIVLQTLEGEPKVVYTDPSPTTIADVTGVPRRRQHRGPALRVRGTKRSSRAPRGVRSGGFRAPEAKRARGIPGRHERRPFARSPREPSRVHDARRPLSRGQPQVGSSWGGMCWATNLKASATR